MEELKKLEKKILDIANSSFEKAKAEENSIEKSNLLGRVNGLLEAHSILNDFIYPKPKGERPNDK